MRFAEWTLDEGSRRLYCGTDETHLSTKAFDLLVRLVAARPHVLSKIELQEAIWPGVFVSEGNLFTLVSEIRTAIKDDARDSRLVRTVHRVGYAFTAKVDALAEAPLQDDATARYILAWEGRMFPLAEGVHVIGRDSDAEVTLDSPTVSRRHATLTVGPAGATLQDLQSKNGTFVNDVRIVAPKALAHGDRVRIGSLVTRLRRVGPASTTETSSAATIQHDEPPIGEPPAD